MATEYYPALLPLGVWLSLLSKHVPWGKTPLVTESLEEREASEEQEVVPVTGAEGVAAAGGGMTGPIGEGDD